MLPDPAPSNDLYVVTSVSVKEKLMTYSESDIAIVGMNCRYPRRAQRCGIRNGASHRMQHLDLK